MADTKYAVQELDYPDIIRRMAEADFQGMEEVLKAVLKALPKPHWQSEQRYFWIALFNAARENDLVWMWLMSQPHIRHFGPPGSMFHTSGRFCPVVELPEIGGVGDEWVVQGAKLPKRWPAEPTEENFRAQAAALDAKLRELGRKNPENVCKTVAQYVASFYFSGSGQGVARILLMEAGFLALATPKGIQWLMTTYPPAGARATT